MSPIYLNQSLFCLGVYIYRVHVASQTLPGEGEAVANITVLPVPRVNTPPVAVIKPPNQTVTLPTNKVLKLDCYDIIYK